MFWQTIAKVTVSNTVIVATQLAVFPLASVAVTITVLEPRSVQLKVVALAPNAGVPQPSVAVARSGADRLA